MNNSEEHKNEAPGQNKEYSIIVNGQQKVVTSKELTFAEVVALDEALPSGQYIEYTVTYRRGHGNKPEGSMVDGDTVKVKEGMIFNVTATDKS